MKPNERAPYIKTIMLIAASDDNIDDEEIAYLKRIGKKIGLSDEDFSLAKECVLSKAETINDVTNKLQEKATKLSLLYELLVLCYADSVYTIVEKQGMRDLCIILGLESKELDTLEKSFSAVNSMKSGMNSLGKKLNILGEKSVEGGKKIAQSVASGIGTVGSKISLTIANSKQLKEENKNLREELKKITLSEAVKQKIVLQLNSKITSLKTALQAEKERNQKNEDMIKLLQEQISDLMLTVDVAEAAKTA